MPMQIADSGDIMQSLEMLSSEGNSTKPVEMTVYAASLRMARVSQKGGKHET